MFTILRIYIKALFLATVVTCNIHNKYHRNRNRLIIKKKEYCRQSKKKYFVSICFSLDENKPGFCNVSNILHKDYGYYFNCKI